MVPYRPLTLRKVPRVLSIAGTDPTGGAGIQADLKSIAALGGYGMAVVTSLVAQNTCGVRSLYIPPASFLIEQLDAVSDDVRIDAVKIGMLGKASMVVAVRNWLYQIRPPLVVLDPVMVATSGDRLLTPDAETMLRKLVSCADLVTPNLPELAVLVDEPVAVDWATALEQGRKLSESCGTTVLVKGGHLTGESSPDALVDYTGRAGGAVGGVVEFTSPRLVTKNTHGTGCSLSSAVATTMAQTGNWAEAVSQAKVWLHDAILHADALEVGQGNGPINHFHRLWAAANGLASGWGTPRPDVR